MAKKQYGIAVIGAGWVSSQHIAAYRNNPNSRILAICDINTDNASQRAAEAGLRDVAIYDNAADAIGHDGVDAVSICTPQHIHYENVLVAAKQKKHMLIEKPLAHSIEQIRQMQDAVNKAGVKTVVGFVLRWNPLFQNIKKLITRGELGEVYYVETDYQSYNSAWWPGWQQGHRKDLSHSAMAVAGCHAVDALRWFAAGGENQAAEPIEVFGYEGGKRKGQEYQYNPVTNDWSKQPVMEYHGLEVLLVRFSNGVMGKVSVNFEGIQPYTFPINIFGDKGTIKKNKLFAPKSPNDKQWCEIPGDCPDSSDVTHHPFQGEIDHFIECIDKDIESHCNINDAIKTHEIFFAAQKCYEIGKAVKLPLI